MSSQPGPPLSVSRKRSHDGELINNASNPPEVVVHPASDNIMSTPARQSSPAISICSSGSALTELTPSFGKCPTPAGVGGSVQKKPKLTFAEREVERAVKRRGKEEREIEKADEKARKEQEKREKEEEKEAAKRARGLEKSQRDAEKAKRDAVKAEKQKIKDTEKQAKDAEKAQKDAEKVQKEAEKLKKERAQMRLGTFFQKPAQAPTPPSIAEDVSSGVSSRRSSITSIDGETSDSTFKSTRAIPADFGKWFLPFFVESDMEVAPANRFITSLHALDLPEVDRLLKEHQETLGAEPPEVLKQYLQNSHTRAHNGKYFVPVRNLVEKIEKSHNAPIDLTNDNATNSDQELLEAIPMKVLSYSVDVRPPYQGTFTRFVSPKSIRKISRRPHRRLLPDINYDYDSEGEWEPPEDDDEDLNSEDEEGSIDNEDEEMGDFLDDADDVAKRRMIVGDVEPVSSGLCWQENGKAVDAAMKQYRLDVLNDAHLPFPIDPFSTKYWAKPAKPASVKVERHCSTVAVTTMQPPRLPLTTVSANNTLLNGQGGFVSPSVLPLIQIDGENAALSIPKQRGRASDPNKPLKLIGPDLLPAFKHAVEGSDLTKAGLIEILKKQFPKVAKDVIKDTLGAVAQRSGAKEADKRWVLN